MASRKRTRNARAMALAETTRWWTRPSLNCLNKVADSEELADDVRNPYASSYCLLQAM
jgi:hypothetical protein